MVSFPEGSSFTGAEVHLHRAQHREDRHLPLDRDRRGPRGLLSVCVRRDAPADPQAGQCKGPRVRARRSRDVELGALRQIWAEVTFVISSPRISSLNPHSYRSSRKLSQLWLPRLGRLNHCKTPDFLMVMLRFSTRSHFWPRETQLKLTSI